MRTNVEIDDNLMKEALVASGASTKREAIEKGLRLILQMHAQKGLLSLRGIGWEGDLEAMRTD